MPPDPPSLLTLTGVSRRYGERLALLASAVGPSHPGALARALVIGGGLAAGLGIYAARRAGRLGSA